MQEERGMFANVKMGPIFAEDEAKEKMCPACFGNPSEASLHCIGGRCAKWVSVESFCVEGICPIYKECHDWQNKCGSEECTLLIRFATDLPESIKDSETGTVEVQLKYGFCSL